MKVYKSEKIYELNIMLILIFICVLYIIPILHVLSASFSSPRDVFLGNVYLLPKNISIESYKEIIKFDRIWIGYLNSIYYAAVATLVQVSVCFMAAFALTNKRLPFHSLISKLLLITMFFSGGLIPTYILVTGMGLGDTVWALVLPGTVNVWNILVIRTYIKTAIPEEIKESATIDGISTFGLVLRIILPLSKSIIVVIALYTIVGSWNNYFQPMIYLTSPSKHNLQLVLRDLIYLNDVSGITDGEDYIYRMTIRKSLIYSSIVVASAPILFIYPFFSKYFEKGIITGSLKG